jgi:taurine dioxygenase
MPIEIEPLTTQIGAEIHDVDLSEPLPDSVVADIGEALLVHKVLFFRGQHLEDRQLRDAAGRFGPLEAYPLAPGADPDVPQVHELSFDDGSFARGSRVDSWHTDGTYMECPPMATMLYAVEIPPCGGDTCFATTEAAYEALSPMVRALIDDLTATHDYAMIAVGVVLLLLGLLLGVPILWTLGIVLVIVGAVLMVSARRAAP